MRLLATAVTAAVTLSACADDRGPATATGAILTGAELAALYPGGPYAVAAPDGARSTVTAAADRTAEMRLADGSRDAGRWRIDGDTVCFTWTRAGGGAERCGHIQRFADGSYRSVGRDGAVIVTFRRAG
ncbi:MAG: hypothetical protein AB7O45_04110 [Alphaproteobacteria bacterium]